MPTYYATVDELREGFTIRAATLNIIILKASHYIRVRVMDEDGEILSELPCYIEKQSGEKVWEGKTCSKGQIRHDGVSLGDYNLIAGTHQTYIPTVSSPDVWTAVWLPKSGYLRIVAMDEDGDPLPDLAYRIENKSGEILWKGKTCSEGRIRHDDVPFEDFELVIGSYQTSIPPVALEEEWIPLWLPKFGYIRLSIMNMDGAPLARLDYRIKNDENEELFAGVTDNSGKINHDLVLLDDYRLKIGNNDLIVPAVLQDDAYISVFLPSTEPKLQSDVKRNNREESQD